MASAPMIAGGRGGLGWVILVAALAVPGVLFYNWWSHIKAEREKTVAAKARGRVPEGGVFQTSPSSVKLVNPMAKIVPAVPAAPIVPVVPIVPAAPTLAAAAKPGLKRDPMLSPFDLLRLKQEADDKRRTQEALDAERSRTSRRAGRRASAPETLIELQGIISAPEGESKAIINNESVGVGEMVGKFRVLSITAAGVTFEYKGRRFTKSVNRE